MFDPIRASNEIKESYIDYITTSFQMSDPAYRQELRKQLEKEGMVAKGPFLDIGGSYETGHTLRELIENGQASMLFSQLEPIPEKERELKLDRPLYSHQETALQKASAGENLVVTTGTGSGKTESFLLPIIDHLLREQENGILDSGVRAIIIYPMNALANDQMKRMRALFKSYPQIHYGVYNGNTRHSEGDARREYRRTYHDDRGNPVDPAPNEIISREAMQKSPPHILITNYSMLEYMMLRPKDDKVFSGAKLKYIVLDEAHIYKGATGMETSLLMRRLRARISQPGSVQYILTSATLGGPDADHEIVNFAEKLCGVTFRASGIVRSREKRPSMVETQDFPPELFKELNQAPQDTQRILEKYQADFAPDGTAEEKLYALFLHSAYFSTMRKAAAEPVTVAQLRKKLSEVHSITNEQVVALIAVCARAEKDGASLIKPRYHFFVRALEGAFITLAEPKRLFLQRKLRWKENDGEVAVFEAAVCEDCGQIAVVGREDKGYLIPAARNSWIHDDADFYCVKGVDGTLLDDEEQDENDDGSNDYVVCSVCGAISTEADTRFKSLCEHAPSCHIKVRKVRKTEKGTPRCPACSFGSFRRFYLGAEAATAVLGTELFEQLPSEEIIISAEPESQPRRGVFAKTSQNIQTKKRIARQFLCFSDSRSEAAFFASYMERSYQDFLRRRGIWHVAKKLREAGETTVSVSRFVDELRRFFEANRSFRDWDKNENQDLFTASRSNAWAAVLNEMYNARRGTSLVSMGVLSFEYRKNVPVAESFQTAYHLELDEAQALLELLAQDAVFSGALDAGKEYTLDDAEREYIFLRLRQRN